MSLLLFGVFMDVVHSDARSGIPSELLYADYLVLMAPKMEPLGIRMMQDQLLVLYYDSGIHTTSTVNDNYPRTPLHCA